MTRAFHLRRETKYESWGEELRAARRARVIRRRRAGSTGVIAGLLLASSIMRPAPLLLWNGSRSAPLGLYTIRPGAALHVGDMVAARMPATFAAVASARRYLPRGAALVKRIAALLGDEVCAAGSFIRINGRDVVHRLARDAAGRPLPAWTGCRRLRGGDILLLNADVPTSFDGRYFGVTQSADVIGRARLLWAR